MEQYLKQLSEAYDRGDPLVSDEEYDTLEQMYGQVIEGLGEVDHPIRMYSLQKHYVRDGTHPLAKEKLVKTPKFDGAAVALYYVNTELVLALTRGNGKRGRDITEKMRHLVPSRISVSASVQITGEVVASKDIANSRNYASGALNQKEIDSFLERVEEGAIQLISYSIKDLSGEPHTNTYETDLSALEFYGFNPANGINLEKRYPTDGIVYRVNDNRRYMQLGFTDKFPRGAYAFKTEKEAVETTLLDVVWQTGKSGKVTPVAILETIEIEGAKVSRATLNNIAYIEALNLEIGCTVKVIRSGEIIPKIIGRVD